MATVLLAPSESHDRPSRPSGLHSPQALEDAQPRMVGAVTKRPAAETWAAEDEHAHAGNVATQPRGPIGSRRRQRSVPVPSCSPGCERGSGARRPPSELSEGSVCFCACSAPAVVFPLAWNGTSLSCFLPPRGSRPGSRADKPWLPFREANNARRQRAAGGGCGARSAPQRVTNTCTGTQNEIRVPEQNFTFWFGRPSAKHERIQNTGG